MKLIYIFVKILVYYLLLAAGLYIAYGVDPKICLSLCIILLATNHKFDIMRMLDANNKPE